MTAFPTVISNEAILSSLGHQKALGEHHLCRKTPFHPNPVPVPHTHSGTLHLGREPTLIGFAFGATKVLSGLLAFSLLGSQES